MSKETLKKMQTVEIRFADLTDEQLSRLVWYDPEKWGIKRELIDLSDSFGDTLNVEKTDGGFTLSFDLYLNCTDYQIHSTEVTIEYTVDEDDLIDIRNCLDYDEFEGVEDFVYIYEE